MPIILSISISVFILTIPLFINGYAFYISENKSLYFSVKLFFIPLIRGKVYYKNKLFIQYNKKITPLKMNKTKFKSGIKPLFDFNIIKFKNTIKIGTKYNMFMRDIICFLVIFSENFLIEIIKNKRPYVKTYNALDIYEDENFCKIYFSICAVLNLYVVIANIIKILLKGVINRWMKKIG